jgi:DNA polymerase-4
VREILGRYAAVVEPLSLDEAYIDVTDSPHEGGSATRIAERIRREIKAETGLTASAGVAPNKFLAKIASDLRKPDGLAVIRPEQIEAFMKSLAVEKIWGVGKVTAEKMHRLGIRTCGDLQAYSIPQLVEMFGSWGPQLFEFARGIDRRRVSNDRERKSLSVEETYSEDLVTRGQAMRALVSLYEDFRERMEKYRARGEDESEQLTRSVVVKVKFRNFRSKGRETKWSAREIPPLSLFEELLGQALDGETLGVRLLGLGAKFTSASKAENKVEARAEDQTGFGRKSAFRPDDGPQMSLLSDD